MKVVYNSKFVPKGYKAWVIYPYMFFSEAKCTDVLFRHELQHVYQVRKYGWFKFYATYLWYSATKGYWDNPYEIEARGVQNTPLTQEERRLKEKK